MASEGDDLGSKVARPLSSDLTYASALSGKSPLNTSGTEPAEDEWEADDKCDEFWGPDESEYWQREAEEQTRAKAERTERSKVPARKVTELVAEVLHWEQPSNDGGSIVEEVKQAHRKPLPLTYTVVNPATDKSQPENRRRLFGNLHGQLAREIDKALKCGSWTRLGPDVLGEMQALAVRPAELWEDMDMTMQEPRIRELVRMLIASRREMGVW
ncbi:uncharacterized protein PV09_03814 [Verruconis gallopava]|uniref:Uncharacterized protein n=1 Tax=Verruconis gallopava TaxID=253628 RepID=A0A0D1YX46_9PEZI|nr:uncharacterized protein PV09_03814 [Verruconis gallopava]KIW05287.1 hypothetical protein PV09_03814 [Verruconis gallopava]